MRYPKEQEQWIKDNLQVMEWRNTKHFTDVFNLIFKENKNASAMNCYLNRNGMQLLTRKTAEHYTEAMDKWLVNNIAFYDGDFVRLAEDFNVKFGTNYSNCRLAKRCERMKIHNPRRKTQARN